MLVFFARSGQRHPMLPVALGLVLGGSVSNLVDRVRLGHVTDFLDVRYWPAFNLADTFIVRRRRDPVRRARAAQTGGPATAAAWQLSAFAPLRRGARLDRVARGAARGRLARASPSA